MNNVLKAPAFRLCAAVIALTAVSGCLGSNGGGGGGGGGFTPEEYDDALADVQGRIPTSDMPREGTASYSGAARVDGVDGADGFVVGEVNLDVDFDAEPTEAISGTATNFSGVLDGEEVTIGGTLSTGPDFPTALAINEFTVDLPTGGSQTVVTGAVSIAMYGDVVDEGDTSTILLTLGGNFVGPEGEGIHGPALIQEITDTSVGENVGAGTWWVLRD